MRNYIELCYWDGLTIEQTKDFIEKSLGKKPSEKLIAKIKEEIKQQTNKEWK